MILQYLIQTVTQIRMIRNRDNYLEETNPEPGPECDRKRCNPPTTHGTIAVSSNGHILLKDFGGRTGQKITDR